MDAMTETAPAAATARRHSWATTRSPGVQRCRRCDVLRRMLKYYPIAEYRWPGGKWQLHVAVPPCPGP